jgi:hypothetical protein
MGSSHVEHWLVGAHGRFRPRTPHLPRWRSRGRLHRTPCSLDVNYSVLRESHPRGSIRADRSRLLGKSARHAWRVPGTSSSPSGPTTFVPLSPLRTAERARASIFVNLDINEEESQATKSQRWMPWRQMPMKDVDGCDKPRGAAYQASIRGSPNGETRQGSCPVTPP